MGEEARILTAIMGAGEERKRRGSNRGGRYGFGRIWPAGLHKVVLWHRSFTGWSEYIPKKNRHSGSVPFVGVCVA